MRPACTNYRDNACHSALALPLYGAHPSAGICRVCPYYDGPSRGLGDVIHKVTTRTGIARAVKIVSNATGKPCGCEERRRALNEQIPFKGT